MQIPYEVQARPDTGLYNAKVGIWLFLASEVMLFGGLFSAYIFLRLGADDGYWPHGLLNVPIGTFNTFILIASSVTVIRAWVALKMRRFAEYKKWMGITIVCGAAFLFIKLAFEWPPKFNHFGAIMQKDKWAKYEPYLGNEKMKEKGLHPRNEISGHLHGFEVTGEKAVLEEFGRQRGLKQLEGHGHGAATAHAATDPAHPPQASGDVTVHFEAHSPRDADALVNLARARQHENLKRAQKNPPLPPLSIPKIVSFEVMPDPVNEKPLDDENLKPHFWPKSPNKNATPIKIEASDIHHWSAFVPKHSTYFSTYFMITGLHGLHVLGGVLVFIFLWGPGAALYKKNPEHLANRVEVAGLFWHFVDLVWIFVFPLFYLL